MRPGTYGKFGIPRGQVSVQGMYWLFAAVRWGWAAKCQWLFGAHALFACLIYSRRFRTSICNMRRMSNIMRHGPGHGER